MCREGKTRYQPNVVYFQSLKYSALQRHLDSTRLLERVRKTIAHGHNGVSLVAASRSGSVQTWAAVIMKLADRVALRPGSCQPTPLAAQKTTCAAAAPTEGSGLVHESEQPSSGDEGSGCAIGPAAMMRRTMDDPQAGVGGVTRHGVATARAGAGFAANTLGTVVHLQASSDGSFVARVPADVAACIAAALPSCPAMLAAGSGTSGDS